MLSDFTNYDSLITYHYYRINHFSPRMQIWLTDIVQFYELRKLQGQTALMVKVLTDIDHPTIDIIGYLILTLEEIPIEELDTELFIAKL